jgi:hypothetical protein
MSNWSDLNDKPCDFIWTTARPDVSHGCNLRDGHQGVHVCCSCKVTSALVRCGCCSRGNGREMSEHEHCEWRAMWDDTQQRFINEINKFCPDCGISLPSSSAPTPEMER